SDNHDRITTDNHPGRPAKMIVGKPAVLLDAIHNSGVKVPLLVAYS
ncbi:hypothetical protein J2793_007433, partial [Paraburkholderia caledonica]|nr:hypothetical protein [Paraburkholderia caledonica]